MTSGINSLPMNMSWRRSLRTKSDLQSPCNNTVRSECSFCLLWRHLEGGGTSHHRTRSQYRHTLLWDMVIISHLTHWKSQKNNHWQGHYESELLVKFDFYILMVGTLSPVVYILFMSGKFHTRETSCLSLSSTTAEISWGELRHSLIISVSARKINMDNIWLSLVTLGTHLTCDLNLQHNKQGRLLTS